MNDTLDRAAFGDLVKRWSSGERQWLSVLLCIYMCVQWTFYYSHVINTAFLITLSDNRSQTPLVDVGVRVGVIYIDCRLRKMSIKGPEDTLATLEYS